MRFRLADIEMSRHCVYNPAMEQTEKHIAELVRIYDAAVETLKADMTAFAKDGTLPPADRREARAWCYPELRIRYHGTETQADLSRAFGRLQQPGDYATTITRPAFFADYLAEQLDLISGDYEVEILVGRSAQEIPFPYVIDASADLGSTSPQQLARIFPSTELALIGDELADGIELDSWDDDVPLALFDALRTDFSLARLAHYSGTRVEDFQRFILFTNYHRYVDEFVGWAGKQLGQNGYTALSGAGGLFLDAPVENARDRLSDTAWRRHQMPAYHLMTPDGAGITLVNIGVGPSNAKTICDHLAVLRPEAWLMIGHCGGLRDTQRIGDYVLAHAYLRDDHVLDMVLPPEIPIPAIAEVQVALAWWDRAADRAERGGVTRSGISRSQWLHAAGDLSDTPALQKPRRVTADRRPALILLAAGVRPLAFSNRQRPHHHHEDSLASNFGHHTRRVPCHACRRLLAARGRTPAPSRDALRDEGATVDHRGHEGRRHRGQRQSRVAGGGGLHRQTRRRHGRDRIGRVPDAGFVAPAFVRHGARHAGQDDPPQGEGGCVAARSRR